MASSRLRFALGLFTDAPTARRFGRRVAEKPIREDMARDAALGKPGSDLFIDLSGQDSAVSLLVWLALRGNLPASTLSEMFDYRHRRGAYAALAPAQWQRPHAVVHTRLATEFYRIEPAGARGGDDSDSRSEAIQGFFAAFGLPYVPGTAYLASGARTCELDLPRLRPARTALMRLFALTRLKVHLVWERPAAALIRYALEVEIASDDGRLQRTGAMTRLARDLAQLAVQESVQVAHPLPMPQGELELELPESLQAFEAAIRGEVGRRVDDPQLNEPALLLAPEPAYRALVSHGAEWPPRQMPGERDWIIVPHAAANDEVGFGDVVDAARLPSDGLGPGGTGRAKPRWRLIGRLTFR